MIAIPAIWLFTSMVLTIFALVLWIGFMYFILFVFAYLAAAIIRNVVRFVTVRFNV